MHFTQIRVREIEKKNYGMIYSVFNAELLFKIEGHVNSGGIYFPSRQGINNPKATIYRDWKRSLFRYFPLLYQTNWAKVTLSSGLLGCGLFLWQKPLLYIDVILPDIANTFQIWLTLVGYEELTGGLVAIRNGEIDRGKHLWRTGLVIVEQFCHATCF